MNASDIMTSAIDLRDRCGRRRFGISLGFSLQHHISAIPILDDESGLTDWHGQRGRPLRPRRNRTRRAARVVARAPGGRRNAWPRFPCQLASPRTRRKRHHVDAVITVAEDTDTGEIARLLAAHRVKRVPVVRNGQVVGIVSRENLLCMLASEDHDDVKPEEGIVARAFGDVLAPLKWRFERPRQEAKPHAALTAQPDEASSAASDFRQLAADFKITEAHRREDLRQGAGEERRHRAEELIGKHISDGSWRHLLHEARTAAGQGLKEFLLLRFPSQVCSDGGRAVNVPDPGWPATLRGEAAEIYSRWSHDLQAAGFPSFGAGCGLSRWDAGRHRHVSRLGIAAAIASATAVYPKTLPSLSPKSGGWPRGAESGRARAASSQAVESSGELDARGPNDVLRKEED